MTLKREEGQSLGLHISCKEVGDKTAICVRKIIAGGPADKEGTMQVDDRVIKVIYTGVGLRDLISDQAHALFPLGYMEDLGLSYGLSRPISVHLCSFDYSYLHQ